MMRAWAVNMGKRVAVESFHLFFGIESDKKFSKIRIIAQITLEPRRCDREVIRHEIYRDAALCSQRPHVIPRPHVRIDGKRIGNIKSAIFVGRDINRQQMHGHLLKFARAELFLKKL